MQTVLVEIDDQNGLNLLQDLEKLNVLRIVKEKNLEKPKMLSKKYEGVFSEKDAESFMQHTQSMRNEWDDT